MKNELETIIKDCASGVIAVLLDNIGPNMQGYWPSDLYLQSSVITYISQDDNIDCHFSISVTARYSQNSVNAVVRVANNSAGERYYCVGMASWADNDRHEFLHVKSNKIEHDLNEEVEILRSKINHIKINELNKMLIDIDKKDSL